MTISKENSRFQATLDPLHSQRLATIMKLSKKSKSELLTRWIDQEYTLVTQWNQKKSALTSYQSDRLF